MWDDGEVSTHTRHKRGEGVVAGVMEAEMATTLAWHKRQQVMCLYFSFDSFLAKLTSSTGFQQLMELVVGWINPHCDSYYWSL